MRSGNFRIPFVAIALQVVIAGALSGQTSQLLVNPAKLYLDVAPGRRIERRVVVATVDALAHIEPFTLDELGRPRLGTLSSRNLAPWITVSAETQSGGTVFAIAIDIPSDARGSYWAALIVEDRRSSHHVRVHTAVPIIVTVAGTEESAIEVLSMQANEVTGGSVELQMAIENRGNVVFRGPIAIVVDRDSSRVATNGEPVLLLPGARRLITGLVAVGAGGPGWKAGALIGLSGELFRCDINHISGAR